MPYDLFVSDQDHDSLHTLWEFYGTYTKLWHVQADIARAGEERPTLRRWVLMYIRKTTTHTGAMHSSGEYPQQKGETDAT